MPNPEIRGVMSGRPRSERRYRVRQVLSSHQLPAMTSPIVRAIVPADPNYPHQSSSGPPDKETVRLNHDPSDRPGGSPLRGETASRRRGRFPAGSGRYRCGSRAVSLGGTGAVPALDDIPLTRTLIAAVLDGTLRSQRGQGALYLFVALADLAAKAPGAAARRLTDERTHQFERARFVIGEFESVGRPPQAVALDADPALGGHFANRRILVNGERQDEIGHLLEHPTPPALAGCLVGMVQEHDGDVSRTGKV